MGLNGNLSALYKIFCARLCIILLTFLSDLMSELSDGKNFSAATKRYSSKTLKIDGFSIFRNFDFAPAPPS